MSEEELMVYNESWNTSVKRLQQLLQYIIGTSDGQPGLTPHKVRDSRSVIEAKRILAIIQEPLAKITNNIEFNFGLLNEHRKEIETIGNDIERLRAKLYLPLTEIETIMLDSPQTVCMGKKCIRVYTIYGDKKVTLNKKCHLECREIKKPILKVGDPTIKKCNVIKLSWFKFKCDICGCSYKKHTHSYNNTKLIEKLVIDDQVRYEFENAKSAIEAREVLIRQTEQTIADFQAEKLFVMQASAKFASFIKANAITPYSDIYKVRHNSILNSNFQYVVINCKKLEFFPQGVKGQNGNYHRA